MSTAAETALAALRMWAARAGLADDTVGDVPPETAERVRAAAALVLGGREPAPDWQAAALLSIFARVKPKDGARLPPEVYVRRASLTLDDTVLFPTPEPPAARPDDGDPALMLRRAVAAIDARGLLPELAAEALLYALQRHAWCLPSPLPAVALADFARSLAAVAAAQTAAPGDLFLLGGDLSGVQSFLYTLTADGATKSLRGRSFYLQLLTEACARALLRAAGMPLTNLLYAGGGRFYALLPRRIGGVDATAWLDAQRAFFDAFLLRHHQGELYLALGGAPLPVTALLDGEGAADRSFSATWRAASEEANAAKRRRFSGLGADGLGKLFALEGSGGGEGNACAICDYQGIAEEFEQIDTDNPQAGVQCKLCESFEELGRLLHNAEYLLLHHVNTAQQAEPHVAHAPREPWHAILAELGIQVQLRGKRIGLSDSANKRTLPESYWTTVLALGTDAARRGEGEVATYLPLTKPLVYGFRPVANASPMVQTEAEVKEWDNVKADDDKPVKRGEVKPFGLMVEQSVGVKRLGVLRMDVDDLGDLFRYRLDGGLARVSALSAALALFFEGRVGLLCDQRNKQLIQRVYSIYSGGDDLFIVGSWDALPELARAIRDDLLRYTGNHPEVHLSAGISLHTAKFPLYQAAEAAGKELKRAKARPGKNALGWLEQVMGWEYADDLFTLKEQLLDYTGEQQDKQRPPLSRAVLQTLQVLYAQYAQALQDHLTSKRPGQLFYGPWIWRGVYQLSRIRQQARANEHPRAEKAAESIKELVDGLLDGAAQPPNTGGRAIERNGLAARWVQLLIRKEHD
jgi:CRISPR-associated protein Csm1